MTSSYRPGRWSLSSFLVAFVCLLAASVATAQSEGGDFYQKYKRRQAQRFDLISYLSDQKRIRSEQDAKWGYIKDRWPFEPDLKLSYYKQDGDLERGSVLGEYERSGGRAQFFMNGLFTDNNKRRAINIDLGFEGYYHSGKFTAEPGSAQSDWRVSETGGGLLVRPFGRSSQDTGLFFKGGYAKFDTRGLWGTSATQRSLASPYWGGEAKLYLLPFLGARAEYTAAVGKEDATIGGRWSQSRVTYGAFLELFVLSVEAHIFEDEYLLKPSGGGAPVRDSHTGVGLVGSLHF